MNRLLTVVILCAALAAPGCVRECRCVVTVAPGADGCLVASVEEETTEESDTMDPGTLDALWTVGRTALDVVVGLLL